MRSAKLTRVVTAACTAVALAACSDQVTPEGSPLTVEPEPGTLTVSLSSIRRDLGAVSFRLSGEGVEAIRAASDDVRVFSEPDGEAWRIAALGAELHGALVRFDVPDVHRAAEYAATLLQVSDVDNELLRDGPQGVELQVAR